MKKNVTRNPVYQTPFELAVYEVVDALVNSKHQHGKFKNKQDLLNEFGGIGNNSWAKYKAGERNIPDKYHDRIKDVLVKKYGVDPLYLKYRKGEMFVDGQQHQLEDSGEGRSYGGESMKGKAGSDIVKELNELKKTNKMLLTALAEMGKNLGDVLANQSTLSSQVKQVFDEMKIVLAERGK